MLLSIVISLKNGANDLERTLQSIVSQDFGSVEVIIQDAVSTDNPEAIVSVFADRAPISFRSEGDTGIYDAWNKAIERTRGEWIYFLGAGDELCAGVLQRLSSELPRVPENAAIAYGQVEIVGESGRALAVVNEPWDRAKRSLTQGMPIFHQGILHRRVSFAEVGAFDDSYRIVGDFDMLLRTLKTGVPHYLDIVVARFALGGASSNGSNLKKLRDEYRRALIASGYRYTLGRKSLVREAKIILYAAMPQSAYERVINAWHVAVRGRSRY